MQNLRFVLIVPVLFITTISHAQSPDHIHGVVELDPYKSHIKSQLSINYNLTKDADSIVFLLHSGLKIENLEGVDIEKYRLGPAENQFGMPEVPYSNLLTVYLKNKPKAGSPIKFNISYQGLIGKDEIIFGPDTYSEQWVELALGSLWYPVDLSFTFSFTHDLQVSLPEEYSLASMGQEAHKKGAWSISSKHKSIDMVIVAAKDLQLKSKTTGNFETDVYSTKDRSETSIDFILQTAFDVQQYYNKTFGGNFPLFYQKFIYPPDRNRTKDEGYSRNPFIMLSHTESGNQEDLFMFIAHEIAHFWWNEGNFQTADNFMNESLAEYSQLMARRSILGMSSFKNEIEKKQDFLSKQSLPSIWDLEKNQELNYALVYVKGPLLLFTLEDRIGEENLIILLRLLIENKVKTLNGFVEALNQTFGQETADWFNGML